jgi:hypothetical protein
MPQATSALQQLPRDVLLLPWNCSVEMERYFAAMVPNMAMFLEAIGIEAGAPLTVAKSP